MNEKPKWSFDISYELAKWIYENWVIKITHHWEMTGVDTAKDWIEIHSKKSKRIGPTSISDHGEVRFRPNHKQLLILREDVIKKLNEINEWEDTNSKDIAEYNRLKNKLGY